LKKKPNKTGDGGVYSSAAKKRRVIVRGEKDSRADIFTKGRRIALQIAKTKLFRKKKKEERS